MDIYKKRTAIVVTLVTPVRPAGSSFLALTMLSMHATKTPHVGEFGIINVMVDLTASVMKKLTMRVTWRINHVCTSEVTSFNQFTGLSQKIFAVI